MALCGSLVFKKFMWWSSFDDQKWSHNASLLVGKHLRPRIQTRSVYVCFAACLSFLKKKTFCFVFFHVVVFLNSHSVSMVGWFVFLSPFPLLPTVSQHQESFLLPFPFPCQWPSFCVQPAAIAFIASKQRFLSNGQELHLQRQPAVRLPKLDPFLVGSAFFLLQCLFWLGLSQRFPPLHWFQKYGNEYKQIGFLCIAVEAVAVFAGAFSQLIHFFFKKPVSQESPVSQEYPVSQE